MAGKKITLSKIDDYISLNDYRYDNDIISLPYQDILKHEPRKYQIDAILNYLLINNFLGDVPSSLKNKFSNNHHLFHCATGSGKTLIMAYLMAHLYTKGYNKILFLTNSVNLINKTKKSLKPSLHSKKCEFKHNFNDHLLIENKKIYIKESSNFTNTFNTIEIVFSTIHDLHNKLNNPKENSLNISDLSKHNILILADEAHHFNSLTKKTISNYEQTWEKTIHDVLNANKNNKLAEFTATMDLSNSALLKKYCRYKYNDDIEGKSKIIYDFTLKEFREYGYSKEIILEKNSNLEERIIYALKSNITKQKIAISNNIPLIPKIFFKVSGKIDKLSKAIDLVFNIIDDISLYDKKNILTPDEKVLLAEYFHKNSYISIHNKDKEYVQKLTTLNDLDDNNDIRMVFAIDILNEGWDVLSLFDIVKMDDSSSDTTKEAQLIGRGARIYPYKHYEYDIYKRKFDNDINHSLRALETLHFFTANESTYIDNITSKLIDSGAVSFNYQNQIIRVKNEKKEKFGNYYVFTNSLIEHSSESLFDLKEYTVTKMFNHSSYLLGTQDIKKNNSLINISVKDIFEEHIHLFQFALNNSYIDLKNIKFKTKLDNLTLLNNIFFNSDKFTMYIDKQ